MDQRELAIQIDHKRTAYHEAAHAVIIRALSLPMKSISISHGATSSFGTTDLGNTAGNSILGLSEAERTDKAISVLAGPIGQGLLIEPDLMKNSAFDATGLERTFHEGNRSDYEFVRLIIVSLVGTDAGDNIKFREDDVAQMLTKLERKTRFLIKRHRRAIEAVAEMLLIKQSLSSDEVDSIMKNS